MAKINFQTGVHLRELEDGTITVGCNVPQITELLNEGQTFINFFIKKNPKTGKLYAEQRPDGYGNKDAK